MRISQLVIVLAVLGASPGQASMRHATEPATAIQWATVSSSTSERRDEPRLESAQNRAANPDALTLQDFKRRVDAYVALHQKAANGAPRLRQSNDPAEILRAQDALAARIRALRADARPGDIFTAEVRAHFRRLLYPETKGEDGADAKAILKDDAPNAVPLTVNAKYPEGAPLPTVPANMLMNLPLLPEQVEYRIVGRHLILRDTLADIIVDFIPNAIQ